MRHDGRGRPPYADVLTPAEWRIVQAVRHGMTNGQIARRRGISLDAVKFHVANALAKLGLESRAALRDWPGVPADSALKNRSMREMEAPLPLGPIGQIAREVSDIKQAEAFFGETLGLPHLYTFGSLAFFDCGGVRLFLDQTENGEKPGPQQCLYFRVADIHAAYEALGAKGIAFRGAPHLIFKHPDGMEEWMAFFDDPDGNFLAIMSQVRA